MTVNSRWKYLLLLNFSFPILALLQAPPSHMAAGGALTLAVLLLYIGVLRGSKRSYVYVLGMLSCTIALAFLFNPMYLYLAFLAADTLSKVQIRQAVTVAVIFACSVVASVSQAGWFGEPTLLFLAAPMVFGICVLPFLIRASVRYKDMAVRLEAAQAQLERMAQDAERRRIAGELHDTLGHTLTFIALKSELAAKLAGKNPERAAAEMEEIRGTARTALKQMRELVSGMRAVRLADEAEHCRSLFAAAGIGLTMEGDFREPPCPVLHETILAMGLREAATNVVRHSGASSCRIGLTADENGLKLTIEDDGKGIGGGSTAPVPGTGLAGMKERLQLIEGSFHAASGAKGGTVVTLCVPVVIRNGREVS